MGIVGYGAIGRAIGQRAEALGMRVIAHDAVPQEGLVDFDTISAGERRDYATRAR